MFRNGVSLAPCVQVERQQSHLFVGLCLRPLPTTGVIDPSTYHVTLLRAWWNGGWDGVPDALIAHWRGLANQICTTLLAPHRVDGRIETHLELPLGQQRRWTQGIPIVLRETVECVSLVLCAAVRAFDPSVVLRDDPAYHIWC